MNNKTNLLTAVIMTVVGVALIVLHDRVDILQWISVLIGVVFIIPSLFALCTCLFGSRPTSAEGTKTGPSASTIIASLGGLGLGLAMCLIPSTFASIFIYVFAGVIIVAGIYHIVIIGWLSKTFILPGFYYVIPALLIVTGLVILFSSLKTLNNVVVLITGIAFLLSAINSYMEYFSTTGEGHRRKPAE